MAQLVVRTKGEVKCQHHIKHDLTYECEKCPGELCCAVCVSSTHKGHPMRLLEECVSDKIASIETLKKKLEKELIPENEKQVKNFKTKLEDNKKHYTSEIQKTKDEGEKLKKLIDARTEKIVADLKKAKDLNEELIRKTLTQLEASQKELKAKSAMPKDITMTGSNVLIYDTESEIQMLTLSEIPKLPSLDMLKFAPCEGPEQFIEKAVGKIDNPLRQEKEETKVMTSTNQLANRQSGSEVSLVKARANVMIYDDKQKRWMPSVSPGLSHVHIYGHEANRTFRVVGRKVQGPDYEVVVNAAILKGLKYNQATKTFHQWRDNRNVYGLNFASAEEADNFAQTMKRAIETLNNAGSSMK